MNLGYACINESLKNCSPGQRITVGRLKRLKKEEQLEKLNQLVRSNLENTLRILKFNLKYKIGLYRLSSDIVPLATHQITEDWDYIRECRDEFIEVGNFIKKHNLRVSMHPGQYTVLNSNKKNVVSNAIKDLNYHMSVLQAMGLDDKAKLILHIGGVYGDKRRAISRFKKNFKRLDSAIKERLVIENDDKSYTTTEVLQIAKELKIPMVFDIHHFNCNHTSSEDLKQLIPIIFSTWRKDKPKIHFSSPSEKRFASHADNINSADFISFIKLVKRTVDKDFDVMLECKNKDKALLKLRSELKNKL